MASTKLSKKRRCAACSYTHKACPDTCNGDNIFPDIISLNDYHLIFHVYGVAAILKILSRSPDDQRHECIYSLSFEAKSRVDSPAHGCSSKIFALEHLVKELQSRVTALEARENERSINVTSGSSSFVKNGYMDLLMAVEEESSGPHSVYENPPMTVENFTVPTLSPYLNVFDYQAAMASCAQSSEVGVSVNSQTEISHISPQRLEQTDLSFTEEDLNWVESPQDVGGNLIDLSSVDFDARDFWEFGTDRGDASHSLIDQHSPGLEFSSLWDISMDTSRDHGTADIAERSSDVIETLSSPLVNSNGKAPMDD